MVRTDTRLGTVEEVLADAPSHVRETFEALRGVILAADPDAVETPSPAENAVTYGVGPRKMKEGYAYLMPLDARVNLGFFQGVGLPVEKGTFCLAFFMSEERIHAHEGRAGEVERVRAKTVPLFRALAGEIGREALSEAVAAHWAAFGEMHGRMEPAELRAFAARSEADCDALLADAGIGRELAEGEG